MSRRPPPPPHRLLEQKRPPPPPPGLLKKRNSTPPIKRNVPRNRNIGKTPPKFNKPPQNRLQPPRNRISQPKTTNKKLRMVEMSVGNGKYKGTVKEIRDDMRNEVTVVFHGHGYYNYGNGSIYEGGFFENKKHGMGKMIFKNGNVYEGEFDHDNVSGKGEQKFKDGRRYVGEFEKGLFHGKGILYGSDGKVQYDGVFHLNKKTGKGKMVYSNGNIFEGTFVDGKRSGKGMLSYKSGTRYFGEFQNDEQNGIGVIKFNNGQYWMGTFKNNKKDQELIAIILSELHMTKYLGTVKQKGFKLSMMKELPEDEFDILLDIIFGEEGGVKVKSYLQKKKDFLDELLKYAL